MSIERRDLLWGLALAGAGLAAVRCASGKAEGRSGAGEEEELPPTEDLMREHGVLDRLLLVYEAQVASLGQGVPGAQVERAAGLIRTFIEDYHERQEEQFVFPRMEKAGLGELVAVLRAQHDAGRRMTSRIRELAGRGDAPEAIAEPIRAFVRMYRPHAAREDTVLFPAFRRVVPPAEFAEIGERFEEREEQLFGKGGFERILGEVASLERELGIHELARFTPT